MCFKAINRKIAQENTLASAVALYKLLTNAKELGTTVDRKRKYSPKALWTEQLKHMDEALASEDELTARKLCNMYTAKKWPDLQVSLATIKRARKFIRPWLDSHPC